MSTLVDSLNEGGSTLTYRRQIAQHVWPSVPAYGMSAAQRTESPDYRDLGQFLYKLEQDPAIGDISANAAAARSALMAMTIGTDFGDYRKQIEVPFQLALLRWDDASTTTTLVIPSGSTAVQLPSTGVTITTDTAPVDTYYFKTTCENAWGNATLVTDTE